MGNKSFSLAVLPLHRFISILIFMYLEKCSVFFFCVCFFVVVFFGKKNWHTENNFLGFYNCHLIFCVSVTTIKMVSTVRFI